MERSCGSQRSLGSLWAEQMRLWNACGDMVREGSKRSLKLWTKQIVETQREGQRFVIGHFRLVGRLSSDFCSTREAAARGQATSERRPSRPVEERRGRGAEAVAERPRAGGGALEPAGVLHDFRREPEASDRQGEVSESPELGREASESGQAEGREAAAEPQLEEELEECPPGFEEMAAAEPTGEAGAEPSKPKRKCRPRQAGKKTRAS